MKMFALPVCLLVALLSIGTAQAQEMSSDTAYSDMEAANIATAEAMLASFLAEDVDAFMALLAEDVLWEVNGSAELVASHGQWHGHEGVTAWIEVVGSELEFLEMTTEGIWADGDMVFMLLHEVDRAKATDMIIDQREICMLRFEDGLIAHMYIFDDSAQEHMAMHAPAAMLTEH